MGTFPPLSSVLLDMALFFSLLFLPFFFGGKVNFLLGVCRNDRHGHSDVIGAGGGQALYSGLGLDFDHFSRISQRRAAPHTPRSALFFLFFSAAVGIGC